MAGLVHAERLPRGGGRVRATGGGRGLASRLDGPVSIVAGCASLQASAAVATTLFATLGAAATSSSRFLAGALVLLVVARPRLRGRSRREWMEVAAFGAATAAANVCLFEAIARSSLGTAVTLQFLGPLALPLLAARRRLDLACAVAVGAAALLTLPVAGPALADALDPETLATLAALGVLGIAVPYALFLRALRHVGGRTYSVLLSLDPAVAVAAGVLLLGEAPGLAELTGVALVVAASAIAVSTRPGPTDR